MAERDYEPEEFEEEVSTAEQQAEQLAYEREYEDDYSWEQLEEDEHGNLRAPDATGRQRARRRRRLQAGHAARVQRGLIRYVQVGVDLSRAAAATDMRPMRAAVVAGALARFIRAFFDENPLSQLGIVIMRDGVARQLTPMTASPEMHIAALRASLTTSGDASLQNALDLAVAALSSVPPYAQRELLLVFAGLSTCDPGDIYKSIGTAKASRVRVSVVGLAAEVHVCRRMAESTGGRYGVALDETHLAELVMEHAAPAPAPRGGAAHSLVCMGFPRRGGLAPAAAVFAGTAATLATGAYACPRCSARVTELPSQCHVCGLTLVSAPHLARSYHHLFPVPVFEEVQETEAVILCSGCSFEFSGGGLRLRCPDCRQLYCVDCDAYIHEALHNCPTCELHRSA